MVEDRGTVSMFRANKPTRRKEVDSRGFSIQKAKWLKSKVLAPELLGKVLSVLKTSNINK